MPNTYVWTGGQPGFAGSITLASPNSPPGGGQVSDIVAISLDLGIQLTPPTATAGVSVFMPAPPTMFLYGDGWWTTACCSKRKNSLPRDREVRRLNRKVNSSK